MHHYFIVFVFFTRGTFAWFLLKLKLNVGYVCQENLFFILHFLLEILVKRQSCLLFCIVRKTSYHLRQKRYAHGKNIPVSFLYCKEKSVTEKSLSCLPKIKIKRRVLLSQVQTNQLFYSPHCKRVPKL